MLDTFFCMQLPPAWPSRFMSGTRLHQKVWFWMAHSHQDPNSGEVNCIKKGRATTSTDLA